VRILEVRRAYDPGARMQLFAGSSEVFIEDAAQNTSREARGRFLRLLRFRASRLNSIPGATPLALANQARYSGSATMASCWKCSCHSVRRAGRVRLRPIASGNRSAVLLELKQWTEAARANGMTAWKRSSARSAQASSPCVQHVLTPNIWKDQTPLRPDKDGITISPWHGSTTCIQLRGRPEINSVHRSYFERSALYQH